MNNEHLYFFQDWFRHHILSFREVDPLHQRSLDLKEAHTFRVCAAADRIASALGLGENDRRIASATALFHDIGRFPQYHRYRTFRDPDSDNHAKLSLWELNRYRILQSLDYSESQIISRAIIFHNRLRIPENLDAESLLHSRLIRDADKVDILRVMVEHCQTEESLQNPVITLGLGADTQVREEVYRLLFARQAMNYTQLRTTNELKVLQMSWVFDINFRPTLKILKESDDIGKLAATLPDTPLLREALDFINDHVEKRLQIE
jgi:HD superfamily phosphohydrolase YqeK